MRRKERRRAVVPGRQRRVSRPYRTERPDEMVLVGEAASWCPSRADVPRFAAHGGESHGQLGHTSTAMMLGVYADLFDDDLDEVGRAMDSLLRRENVAKCCRGRCLCLMSVAVAPFSVLVFMGSIPAAPLNNKRHSARGGVFCWYSTGFSRLSVLPGCWIRLAPSPIQAAHEW